MARKRTRRFRRAVRGLKRRRLFGKYRGKARQRTVRWRRGVKLGLGLPQKVTITHKYNEQIALNTLALGATNTYQWRCNGMYDPNITGTGHQPYYFDQLSALYDHYVVIGSRINIKVSKSDSNTNIPVTVGLYVNDDATVVPTTRYGLMEVTSGRHKIISGYGPGVQRLRAGWSAKKYFGGSILANTELQGTGTSDPTESSVYTVWCNSETNAQQTSVMLDVEIRYIAVWKEIKDIDSS